MTTHNETNIDKLIAEWKFLYRNDPFTIWWDRNKKRYVTHDAMSHKNTEFTHIRRFDMIGTFNINSSPDMIRKMMREAERLSKYETPIPTSMQNLKVDWEE